MNAYDLCQRQVVTIRRHEEIASAAWLMRERGVGCLVVVDPVESGGWCPVGLLTDREIVTKVIACECDPRATITEDVMTPHPIRVRDTMLLEEVLSRMRSAQSRRLLVVDSDDRLVGILARDDVFDHLTQRPLQLVPAPRRLQRLLGTSRP